MEIITGVERRRRWRCEEKLRIVAEVEGPGASFADVARRHEVSRGLLWNWRRQVREGTPAPEPMPMCQWPLSLGRMWALKSPHFVSD